MQNTALISHFNLPEDFPLNSIYPHAPVYLVNLNGKRSILKKTRDPLDMAQALSFWLKALKKENILTVSPLPLEKDNPVAIEEDVWVAYPFIEGVDYQATKEQVESSAILLGQIHNAPLAPLAKYTWGNPDEIDEDKVGLVQLQEQGLIEKEDLTKVLLYFDKYASWLSTLKAASLEWVCGTWDYKANNLIFSPQGPVLIDPDNAGHLPRLLDLALAVLLFHNELISAPGRLFTKEEWGAFQTGYFSQVTLTSEEIKLWPSALRYMFMEEALWLLLSDIDGWKTSHQSAFLKSLFQLESHPWLFEFHKLK